MRLALSHACAETAQEVAVVDAPPPPPPPPPPLSTSRSSSSSRTRQSPGWGWDRGATRRNGAVPRPPPSPPDSVWCVLYSREYDTLLGEASKIWEVGRKSAGSWQEVGRNSFLNRYRTRSTLVLSIPAVCCEKKEIFFFNDPENYTRFAWAGGTCPRFAWAGGNREISFSF